MRHGMVTTVLAAGALALAACGSDADEAVPKNEYLAQANVICAEIEEEILVHFNAFWESLPEGGISPISDPAPDVAYRRLVDTVDTVAPIWRDGIDDLRSLAAPEGDEEKLAGLYDRFETALDEFRVLAVAAAEGGPAEWEAIEASDPFRKAEVEASIYGIDECAGGD